jgi:hypothetical protein
VDSPVSWQKLAHGDRARRSSRATMSGTRADRPQLAATLALARDVDVLVVALNAAGCERVFEESI